MLFLFVLHILNMFSNLFDENNKKNDPCMPCSKNQKLLKNGFGKTRKVWSGKKQKNMFLFTLRPKKSY